MLELVENNEEYQHLDSDAFDVIAEYTNSKELVNIKEESIAEGGKYNMCKAIKELITIGHNEGISIGRSEGEKRALIRMVCRKMAKGKIVSEIAEDLEEDISEIDRIYQAALKYAPDYNIDKIYEVLKK